MQRRDAGSLLGDQLGTSPSAAGDWQRGGAARQAPRPLYFFTSGWPHHMAPPGPVDEL